MDEADQHEWVVSNNKAKCPMKMREYVDGIQGEGSWDRMHDLIANMELGGWKLPPVEVDGRKINIFPGSDREVTLEQIQNEIRKCFAAGAN